MKNIFLISTLFLLFSCGKEDEKTTEKFEIVAAQNQISLNDAQIKNSGIEISTLNSQDISNKIRVNGTIDIPPQGTASVSAPTGGYVKFTKTLPGMYVSRGQTLATLEDPQIVQLQQDYLLAKSNLGYAQKDFSRQKDLNKSKASSDKVMQQAQTEAQNQNIMMRGMAEKLRVMGINPENLNAGNIRRTIAVSAPISGYISSVNVNIGQYVSPTEKLFEIRNTSDKHLALKIFEKDLKNIQPGQRVFAFTNDNPEKKYAATVYLISKDFQADRSVLVHCHFVDDDSSLLAGTFMNAEIETDSQNGLAIPDDAVITWENKQYIFEETKPKTFKMIPINIGNSENGFTEILNTDDQFNSKKIVTKGAYQLLMGLKNVEE